MKDIEQLIAELKTQFVRAFYEQEGLILDDLVVEKVISRLYSSVVFLKAATSQGEQRLVMKQTVHHPANISITKRENQAVVEYDILRKLYPAFQSVPRCSVPCPILVIPEHEAYVMKFVEGRLLGDYFGAAKYVASQKAFSELRDYYYLCGVWLKNLHEFTGIRRAGIDAFDYSLERCEQRLKMIDDAQQPCCPKALTDNVRKYLEKQLQMVNEEDIFVTGRHGDFGSWNIMASPSGITVFDFLGYREDLLPVDLLKMLVSFEMEKKYLFFNSNRINILKSAFIHGYGELPKVTMPILAICETLHRVCCLSASLTSKADNLWRRIEQTQLIRMNVSWLMSDSKNLLWN